MGKSLVSNPPYNMKWLPPPFAQLQPRFMVYETPPKNNANFAFVLTALELIDDKAAFIFPNGLLTSNDPQELKIRRQLIEHNVVDAVISLPDSMFESTSIPVCIIVFNKQKQTRKVMMVDLREQYAEEQRDQCGQFGGAAWENRVYHKTVKVIPDQVIADVTQAIQECKDILGICRAVTPEEIGAQEFLWAPSRYFEIEIPELTHRSFEDIAADYNRITAQKNAIKLTVNESLAKSLGLYETFVMMKRSPSLADSFAIVGQKCTTEDYIQMSKNKAEFKIENKDTEHLPEILHIFLTIWKHRIICLNNEQNRILAEFRDALLPELMSGKIEV